MGSGSWDPSAYASYSSTVKASPTTSAFVKNRSMSKMLDPMGVKVRESRDSIDNPNSSPLIVGVDVTGSMGKIAEVIARESLGTLFNEVLDRKPIKDPHVMFMAIGDAYSDDAPLQVSQFEADDRVISQLQEIWLEAGGGGGGNESYNLAWYFAGFHTSHDSFEKRGKKGYLFTIGDENCHPGIKPDAIRRIFGDDSEGYTNAELLAAAQKYYHVFHLVVEQSNYGLGYLPQWRALLGQNALVLKDYTRLSEVIVSTMQVIEGADVATVIKSWSGDTSLTVSTAISGLAPVKGGPAKSLSVKRF